MYVLRSQGKQFGTYIIIKYQGQGASACMYNVNVVENSNTRNINIYSSIGSFSHTKIENINISNHNNH